LSSAGLFALDYCLGGETLGSRQKVRSQNLDGSLGLLQSVFRSIEWSNI
jgi:hypothetical protein